MSIQEWMTSEPMQQVRTSIRGDTPLSICSRCYKDEQFGSTSRRHKSNQKSVIFTRSNFKESYEQSPAYDKFEGLVPTGMPVDLHIDLGNYCNLACKMCNPQASSTIAVQEVKWGIESSRQYVGTDWTRDSAVWDRTLAEIVSIKELSNIHFMGGETLITPRFKDFVRALLAAGRTDIGISFVTNGTSYDQELADLLKPFKRIGLEVSIESLTAHNHYQRQGTDTDQVLSTIERFQADGFEITLRPAISALTIGTYWTLIKYALDRRLIIKSLVAFTPVMINPAVIPLHIRESYRQPYLDLLEQYQLTETVAADYNESDPNQYRRILRGQIDQALELLAQPESDPENLKNLVAHCRRWDQMYGYNALELYPELQDIFVSYGY